ncbi:MAG TPA: GspH/FimT family protein [Deferrisomatales bacterium]|nr:GspH/FimT family protein [Deferrisomatales bacterium]
MKRRARAGFTLVEAMIVIAIIAIMLAVSAPSLLAGLPGLRVNGAARQVLSDLRLARTLAVEKGAVAVVTFSGTSTYALTQDQDGDGTAETIKTVVLGDDYSNIQFGTNVGGTSDTLAAVTFRTNGSASAGGGVYLRPGGDTDTARNRRVGLVAATGNLRIEQYNTATSAWE